MLAECYITICCLYEISACCIFTYDIIKNEFNCCREEDVGYEIIERGSNIIPVNEIDINTLFTGFPKLENEVID